MKQIYEYVIKFKAENKKGAEKRITLQQSAHSFQEAKTRIKRSMKRYGYTEFEDWKLLKRMSYPHKEGGRKIR